MESVAQSGNIVPCDPREQPVFDKFSDDPLPSPFINLPEPKPLDGDYAASVFRAKRDQILERNELIDERMDASKEELLRGQLLDTHAALKLERATDHNGLSVWPRDMSDADVLKASQVAVRGHVPQWQIIAQYHAAQAVLLVLRKELGAKGAYLAERDIRELAHRCASITQTASLRVLTGQTNVGPVEWSKAKYGFLDVREEW